MDDLTAFLNARLDEWESLGHAATLRAIIKLREQAFDSRFGDDQWNSGYDAAMGDVLRLFAAIFSTHPDYRPEWAPGA